MATQEEHGSFMDITVEDYYCKLDERLGRIYGMNLARWKLTQNTIISILVGYLAVEAGADPTVTVVVIALINGISAADLATVWSNRQPPIDEQSNDNKKQ